MVCSGEERAERGLLDNIVESGQARTRGVHTIWMGNLSLSLYTLNSCILHCDGQNLRVLTSRSMIT